MTHFTAPHLALLLVVLTTSAFCDVTKKTRTYDILAKDGSSRRIKVEEQCWAKEKGQNAYSGKIGCDNDDTIHEFKVLPLPTSQSHSFESRRVTTTHLTPNTSKENDGGDDRGGDSGSDDNGSDDNGSDDSGSDDDTASDSEYSYDSDTYTFIEDEGETYKKLDDPRLWLDTPLLNSQLLKIFTSGWQRPTTSISPCMILPIGAFEVNNTIIYPLFDLHQADVTEDGVRLTGNISYSTRHDPSPPRLPSLEARSATNSSDGGPEYSSFSPLWSQVNGLGNHLREIERDMDRSSSAYSPSEIYVHEQHASAEVLLSTTEDGGILLRRLEIIKGISILHGQEATPIDGLVVTLVPEQNDSNPANNSNPEPSPENEADKLPEASGLTQGTTITPYFHLKK